MHTNCVEKFPSFSKVKTIVHTTASFVVVEIQMFKRGMKVYAIFCFFLKGTLTNIRDLVVAPGQKATFAAQTRTSSTVGNWTTEPGAYR